MDDIYSKSPHTASQVRSTACEFRFNELSWVPLVSSSHPSGVIFGGTENGTVVFIDAHKFLYGNTLSVISSRRDHHGHVLSVDYSVDNRWAISAGGAAQLLLWDLTNLSTPFSPGTPNFTDQVKRVRWNRSANNILVSLSSHRGSLWDMRRPGGPILEFAEFGSGCDWADICWKPDDSSTLIIGSQLALTPGIQKWDLRYPTAPVNEFHVHDRGVTAMDWHKKDPRMVVCAGNDGFVRVFNPETGEVCGALQLQQNDKVRAVTWSEVRPDLLAIQYFQNPTEFRSIEGGCEDSNLGRLNVGVVPAWVSAAPVGASFSLGGRMATHYRKWDEARQIWCYGVEIKVLPVDQAVHESAMELQNACDSKLLGAYCEDRAHGTKDRNLQILWTFLAAMSNKQSRREFIQILGFGEDSISKKSAVSRASTTSNEVTQLTNAMSSMNCSSPKQNGRISRHLSDEDECTNDEVFLQQPCLDYSHLDESGWSLFDALITEDNQAVVDRLVAHKDYATAFMFARDSVDLLHRVTDRYIAEELSAPQRLLSLVSTASFDQLIETFPQEQWYRLLALMLARTDRALMVHYMRKMALKWNVGKGPNMLPGALAAILAQDVELLLNANQSYSLDERIKQAIILRTVTGAGVDESYETLLNKYCEKLIAGGVNDVAWRLLKDFNIKNEHLLSLRHSLYFICGGEERTMTKEPANPRSPHVQAIVNALFLSLPQQRNAVFSASTIPRSMSLTPATYNQPLPASQPIASAPVPPPTFPSYRGVTTSYGSNSIPNTPGHPLQAYQPIPDASMYSNAPTIPGFDPVPAPIPPPPVAGTASILPNNDSSGGHPSSYPVLPSSGPLASYSSTSQNRPMSSISSAAGENSDVQASTSGWNDPPSLPGRKIPKPVGQVLEVAWKPLVPAPVGTVSGLPRLATGTPKPSQSISSHHGQGHHEIPQANLSLEDRTVVERFYQLIDSIIAANRTPAIIHKAEEAKTRLGCELVPRLAAGKLLLQCCELSARGDYRGALATCRQMVQTGGDFVEVSSFVPALKSLFSLAQSTFSR